MEVIANPFRFTRGQGLAFGRMQSAKEANRLVAACYVGDLIDSGLASDAAVAKAREDRPHWFYREWTGPLWAEEFFGGAR